MRTGPRASRQRQSENIHEEAGSVRLDVRLANGAAVLVILLANMSGKIRTAHRNRKQALAGKLRPDVRYLQRRGVSANELVNRFLRCLRRRNHAEPILHLVIFVTRLGQSRHLRQRLDSGA